MRSMNKPRDCSSEAGKFAAAIVVDEECLVLNYEGRWQREGDL